MYALTWRGVDGSVWPLTSGGQVFVPEAGIDSLFGGGDDIGVTVIGGTGARVYGVQAAPMTGTIAVAVLARGASSIDDVLARFRRSWSRRTSGRLEVTRPDGTVVWTGLRLADGLPAPTADPSRSRLEASMPIPVVADSGAWWVEHTGAGTVSVANAGDVQVWPRIVWSGGGGAVTMPSGATFTLPSVSEQSVLSLDPGDSALVTLPDGTVRPALWQQLRQVVMPEGVPAGLTRRWVLPAGATLAWSTGYFDGWRAL